MLLLVTTLSLTFTACGDDDDEPKSPPERLISKATKDQIKETFPAFRLDSIHSHREYNNLKMEYENGLLVAYKECYPNGNVHDGVSFQLTYTPDTVYINSYKAVIGENGLVQRLICPNGKVNEYNYDNQGHLIRYEINTVDKMYKPYIEIKWENDNISSYRYHFQFEDDIPNGPWSYSDVFYTYSDKSNLAGILPPARMDNWIRESGRSVGYGINVVLYYAGILGRGTKNLPKTSYEIWKSGQQDMTRSVTYNLNESGYVASVSFVDAYESINEYFYQ